MRDNRKSQYAHHAMLFISGITVIGLAAGCSLTSPRSGVTGELAPSVSADPSASVNSGQSDVTRVAALLQVGIQQANQKNWLAAGTTFQDVLAINPSNVYALYDLGVIDQTNRDSSGAIGYYERALTVSKKYTPAMYNEAILLEKSSPQQALSLYQQITTINPQAATAYLRMSFVQAELGDHSAAQVSYAKAIAIDPGLGKFPLPSKAAPTATATPART